MPLTDTAIRKAKPAGKIQRLFDGGGLYLEIAPNGGKWWRQKYRFLCKEKRLSHGTYPDVSLAEARETFTPAASIDACYPILRLSNTAGALSSTFTADVDEFHVEAAR